MHRRLFKIALVGGAAILLVGAAVLGAKSLPQEAQIVVDPAVVYQTMTGWEATTWVMDQPEPLIAEHLDQFHDLVVQAGINRLRLEVRSGAESRHSLWKPYVEGRLTEKAFQPTRYPTQNDNDDPNVIDWGGFDFSELDYRVEQNVLPLHRRLEARGERLVVNLCYVSFIQTAPGARYDHRDPEEYAEFVLATYLHLRDKYGFSPDTWEVILEPDNTGVWDGTAVGKAMVAAARRLEANGFKPRFIAPSVTDMAHGAAYIDQIVAVPGAMALVEELSYHRYGGGERDLRAITERARKYGKKTAMLEWWFNKGTPEVLYEDLTVGMNSAWQNQVLREVALDESDPKHPVLRLSKQSRQMAQIRRYVRAGARRVKADSASGRFKPLAFVDARRGAALVVLADGRGALHIAGLPAGAYNVSSATDDRSVAPAPAGLVTAGGTLDVPVPEAGIYTIADARLER